MIMGKSESGLVAVGDVLQVGGEGEGAAGGGKEGGTPRVAAACARASHRLRARAGRVCSHSPTPCPPPSAPPGHAQQDARQGGGGVPRRAGVVRSQGGGGGEAVEGRKRRAACQRWQGAGARRRTVPGAVLPPTLGSSRIPLTNPPPPPPGRQAGENLRLRLTGCEESDISQGFVLSSIKNPVPMVSQFEAQLVILELLEHNPIFTVGYRWAAGFGGVGVADGEGWGERGGVEGPACSGVQAGCAGGQRPGPQIL
jgi:hypothetical protein